MTALDLPRTSHDHAPDTVPRNTAQAIMRGARRRCPACGEGHLFKGYLGTVDHCAACGEAIHHHRADDGPAYITIMVIAHLFVPAVMVVYLAWRPSPVAMAIGFCIAAVAATLSLLPVAKGGMVGLQWARRMHGFDETAPERQPDARP